MKNIIEKINESIINEAKGIKIPATNLTRFGTNADSFVYNTLITLYNAIRLSDDYNYQLFDILSPERIHKSTEKFITFIQNQQNNI